MPKVKCKEVFGLLQNFTKGEVTLVEIAQILIDAGVAKQNDIRKLANSISNRIYNDGYFTDIEHKAIMDYYESGGATKKASDSVTIDYYPDVLVSCGNGIFSLGETKEKMTVPKHFIKGYSDAQKYIIVTAFSDSMQPKIEEKDLLIVRLTNFEEIMDNHIYVFCHEGRFYCKYLSYNVGQIIVRSENPDYPTRYIEKDNLCNFELIGEIVGLMRDLR